MEAKDKSNHLTADSLRRFPQDNWSSTALSSKANDRAFGNVLFSAFSQTLSEEDPVFTFGEPQGHVITRRRPFLVSRTGDDLPPSLLFPPCVHPKRLRVYIRNVSVYTGTTRTNQPTKQHQPTDQHTQQKHSNTHCNITATTQRRRREKREDIKRDEER